MTVADNPIALARQADILEVARSLGAVVKPVSGRIEFAGACPVCGGIDRFSINTGKQVWNCRGCCKGGDVVDLVQHVEGLSFVDAVAQLVGEQPAPERPNNPPPPAAGGPAKPASDEEARNVRSAARIVAELVPLIDTPGEEYLRKTRKIDTDAIADVLKRVDAIGWHPTVYFHQPDPSEPHHELHGRKLGAIVAIMTDPVAGQPTGAISRTYIHHRTKVGKAKTLATPAGIVRLSRDEDVLYGLHLCEGVETGLAGMDRGFRPMWATGSTSLMQTFPVLNAIERLTIFADRHANQAGEKAAIEAARRWREAGRKAHIKRLSQGLGDINDVLKRETR
jgi:Toprim domain/CHC2 zinc finger